MPDAAEQPGGSGRTPAELGDHFRAVYQELRELALRKLGGRPAQTMQATTLVHEVYLRLAANSRLDWSDRNHFFALAAQAMRWIVVDRARRALARKRQHVDETRTLGNLPGTSAGDFLEILSLDEALTRLAQQDRRKADVVLLRYFAGLSVDDTATALDISPATVKREWQLARAWLLRTMRGTDITR